MGPLGSLRDCSESIVPAGHRSNGDERPQKKAESLKDAKLCIEVRVLSKYLGHISCHPGNE